MIFAGAAIATIGLALTLAAGALFGSIPLVLGSVLLGFGWARLRSLPR
jgi:hypothetical protein